MCVLFMVLDPSTCRLKNGETGRYSSSSDERGDGGRPGLLKNSSSFGKLAVPIKIQNKCLDTGLDMIEEQRYYLFLKCTG